MSPEPSRMTPLTAGLLGAGLAFLLAGLLVTIAPPLLNSYGFLKWSYGIGLGEWLLGDEAWAGSLLLSEVPSSGKLLLLLSAFSFLAAFASALPARKRLE